MRLQVLRQIDVIDAPHEHIELNTFSAAQRNASVLMEEENKKLKSIFKNQSPNTYRFNIDKGEMFCVIRAKTTNGAILRMSVKHMGKR